VDIDADVLGGLGDVSSEGARKAGVMGVDLGVLGQEVGADCYERTARIVQQLFPGKLPLELRVDSIHGGASFWNRV